MLNKNIILSLIYRYFKIKTRSNIFFYGIFSSWEDASKLSSGYEANLILSKVLESSLKVKSGEALYERDSVLFEKIIYSWPVTASLMLTAAQNNGELHVLDIGGSLGTSYFQNKKFITLMNSFTWSIVEQKNYVVQGKKYFEDENLKFFENIDVAISNNFPNFVLLSSSAQYISNIDDVLEKINTIKAKYLVFDKTPISEYYKNVICLQYVGENIYDANYPMWIFSEKYLKAKLDRWELQDKFICSEGEVSLTYNFKFIFTGLIFKNKYL